MIGYNSVGIEYKYDSSHFRVNSDLFILEGGDHCYAFEGYMVLFVYSIKKLAYVWRF